MASCITRLQVSATCPLRAVVIFKLYIMTGVDGFMVWVQYIGIYTVYYAESIIMCYETLEHK